MQQITEPSVTEREQNYTGFWVIALACVAVAVFALCGGAAYAGVNQARYSAAKASVGHIEAVLFLAEEQAEKAGLGPGPATFSDLLKSYDSTYTSALSPYERYVLERMLESFGPGRGFDFAVTRFETAAGIQTQIFFFPNPGQTDIRSDRYYLWSGGALSVENG